MATEFVPAKRSKGEVLVFQRRQKAIRAAKVSKKDLENGPHVAVNISEPHAAEAAANADNVDVEQTRTFHWQELCYEISVKGKPRMILQNVDGWVKAGTVTALMVSNLVPSRTQN